MSLEKTSAANHCPLCGESNLCGNLSPAKNNEACWCMDSAISFPDSLLSQVADADKNTSCICQTCAVNHQMFSDNLLINAAERSKK